MKKEIPKATHTGELEIGDAVIPCAVLEDGTRLLSQGGFLKAIGRSRTPKARTGATVAEMPAFLAARNLNPFVDKELVESTRPIQFRTAGGRTAFGYKAEILPKVCGVFLDAKEAEKLAKTQVHIAKRCQILLRGLAHVGIIALVDEATGYQEIRDRIALQKILDKYLTGEYAKWTKTFPDEFYKQLFRLKKLPYPPTSMKRPSYVGHWTNDIVYCRLAPGVLHKLKQMNPRTASGSRRRKHHQHLTRNYGLPELRDHLSNAMFLMRGCTDWNDFKRRLNRAAPKFGDTIPLPLDFPEDA